VTDQEPVEELLGEARAQIASAVSIWEAGTLPQIDDATQCLETAAMRVGTAVDLLRREPPASIRVRECAHSLRTDLARLQRSVDLRTSFCRKLSVRLGISDADRFDGSVCHLEA
jgi:hypothetical protein